MNKITCPLCQSINTKSVESIKTVDIEKAYSRYFGVTTNFKTNEIRYMICSNCRIGFFDPMAAGDEHLYEQLQRFDWYYMDDKPEFSLAKKYIPITGSVLEVGSGRAAFASVAGITRYTGLEFNDLAIEKAVSAGIKLLKETVEDHARFNFSQYDVVASFQVLEHVSSPAAFIKGCVDCLKPEGILILAVPSSDSFAGGATNSYLDMPPHHVTHWSENTMRKICELYSLEMISIVHEPVAEYHLIWAQKILWEKRLRHLLGMKPLLLDASFSAKLVSKVASVMTKIAPVSVNGVNGHTVVAVYRKVA